MTTIPCNLLCCCCRYNLRGINPAGLCPECGHPATTSIIRRRAFASRKEARFSLDWYDHVLETAAQSAELPVDALAVVQTAVGKAHALMQKRDAGAGEICVAVFHLVLTEFGCDTLKAFDDLRLGTSEAVGRAVFALVGVGILQLSDDDHPDNFADLPTMADLWSQASQPEHDWYPLTQSRPGTDAPPGVAV